MQLNVGLSTSLKVFKELLIANPNAALRFELPDGTVVPPSFHVTEVGRVRKDFIDCGGTVRSTESCTLQLWMGQDGDHRLAATKLARIIEIARPLLGSDDLALEVEYDVGVITQFSVIGARATSSEIVVQLGGKHTACLAPDRCGEPTSGRASCCSDAPVAVGIASGRAKSGCC